MNPVVTRYANLQTLSAAAADLICGLAREGVKSRELFTIALAGGNTPRALYANFARPPHVEALPWMQTHLFWGDERYVPAGHPDSNFAMAAQAFLPKVPIPAQHVHGIPTEAAAPEAAAEQYEQHLRTVFQDFGALSADGFPVFDLILLGLGPDGHTASLFPDSPVLQEQRRWAAATPAPKLAPQVRRITLTLPVINAARHVVFLVAGADKQAIVQTILASPEKARAMYPAARVDPEGKLFWFLAT